MSDIDRIRAAILASITFPEKHEYVMVNGREPVDILWMGEAAQALATLYAGYKLGSKIDDIGDAIVRTIDAIGDIARSLSKLIDKLAEVIDAINRFLEAVGRAVDASFCKTHMADIESASINIAGSMQSLKSLPHDPADKEVSEYLRKLDGYSDDLFKAIVRYLRQEGGPPTPAALITCAPSMGLFAQTYTMIQMYKPVARRKGVWQTTQHEFFGKMFSDEFAYLKQSKPKIEQAMRDLNIPNHLEVMTFNGTKFGPSRVAYKGMYPNESKYDKIFTYIQSDTRPDRLRSTLLNAVRQYSWQYYGYGGGFQFSDPALVEKADKIFNDRLPQRKKYLTFLNDSDAFLQLEAKVKDAMTKPVGWE